MWHLGDGAEALSILIEEKEMPALLRLAHPAETVDIFLQLLLRGISGG
jgi:hypothetical protein